MNAQILRVDPSQAEAHRTISQALAAAGDGEAVISVAPGDYPESLLLSGVLTLRAEQGPGSVTLKAVQGSAVVVSGVAVRMYGFTLIGEDTTVPVVDVRSGQMQLEECAMSGSAWAAAVAQDTAVLALRDCQVTNRHGAGVVVTSEGENVIERTTFSDIASSAVVIAGGGRLAVADCVLDGSGGNGICINGHGAGLVERTTISRSGKPAIAVEESASAQLHHLTITYSAKLDAYIASSGSVSLTDSRLSGSAASSVLVGGAAKPLLRDCAVDAVGTGVHITGTARPRVEECTISASVGVLVEDRGEPHLERLTLRSTPAFPDAAGDDGAGTQTPQPLVSRPGGLRVLGASHVVMRDSDITCAEGTGIELSRGCDAHLVNLRLYARAGQGVVLSDGAKATIESAVLRRCGILIGTGAELTLRDSEVVDAPGDGIRVLTEGRLTATGCRVEGAQGQPVNCAPAARADVRDCLIKDTTDAEATPHQAGLSQVTGEHSTVPRPPGAPNQPAVSRTGEDAGSAALPTHSQGGEGPSPSLRPLAAMVGHDEVRAALELRLRQLSSTARNKPLADAANIVLAGERGSGRRAVASAYARCLAEAGILPHGAVHSAALSRFPARWPEQATAWASYLFERADGGVLLLDLDDSFAGRPRPERMAVLDAIAQRADRAERTPLVLTGPVEPVNILLREHGDLGRHFPEYQELAPYLPEQTAELVRRRLEALGLGLDYDAFDTLAAVLIDNSPPDGAHGAHRLAEGIARIARSRTVGVMDLLGDTADSATPTDMAPR